MAVERTLVLAKPDAVERGLAGEIVMRLERRGLALRAAKLVRVETALAEQHYAEHVDKPFFGELIAFITSGADPRARGGGRGRDRDRPAALAAGATAEEAAHLANYAGGIVVMKRGTATVNQQELLEALEKVPPVAREH